MLDLSKITIKNFHYKNEVSSTNDYILELANEGCEEYSTCFAEIQTKGRGRLQRVWQTYPYKSLAFSFFLNDFEETTPLVLCCSIHSILLKKYKSKVAIKWPNDIYYKESKLSGILVESFPLKENNKRVYVVGIGLNVFAEKNSLPEVGFLENTTDCEISRELLINDIFEQIQKDITVLKEQGFRQFKDYFMQNCLFLDQEINVTVGNNVETGKFIGINDKGYLILKQKEVILDITAGQIVQKK